jgi:hypothetical protein
MNFVQYLPWAWPVTAVVSLCVGLAAFGFDVLKVLSLSSFRKPLQYFVGLCGLVSLASWFTDRNTMAVNFPGDPKLASATWFITGLVALCMGLAACGFDLLKTVKLGGMRKAFQYVVGVVGAYSLVAYFGIV